ncbi:MAG: helix-turn-helix domain-containing protein [Limisphaerales bacterium]
MKRTAPSARAGFATLLAACAPLRFAPHCISHRLDPSGRYDEELTAEFPVLVRLFHFRADRFTHGSTWHSRLELFMPLDGRCRMRMGDRVVALQPGDQLVVDNLKLHQTVNDPGLDTRVVVVSFLPEFVYSLGSPSHDYTFLLPFYARRDDRPNVLRRGDPRAGPAAEALARLLECYFQRDAGSVGKAGCRAFLLVWLYHLARHFEPADVQRSEFLRQQELSLRLKPVFEHLRDHGDEKLSLAQAAALVHLSPPQFVRLFKQVAGMTYVRYVNHTRLSRAAGILRTTRRSIADIAAEVGFSDQSYFDRLFRRAFGQPPSAFRGGVRRE